MKRTQKAAGWVFLLVVLFLLPGCTGGTAATPPENSDNPALNTFSSQAENIESFDAVQVMAKGIDADTGAFYDMVNYVAGKDTCLRVLFTEAIALPADQSLYIAVFRDGMDLGKLYPSTDADLARELFFFADAHENAELAQWNAGTYRFVLHTKEGTAERQVLFQETKPIRILALPIKSYAGGTISQCRGDWQEAGQYALDCYPVAKENFEFILGPEVDLSAPAFDLNTQEGIYNVWKILSMLQNPEEGYDLICGFVPEGPAGGKLSGYTYGASTNIIAENARNMPAIVAHEIAHCYGVGDEYPRGSLNLQVNPAPYQTEGLDLFSREAVVSPYEHLKAAKDFGLQGVGCYIYAEQAAYDVTQRLPKTSAGSFMGFGDIPLEETWVTSDIWNHLFTCLRMEDADVLGEMSLAASAALPERWYQCPGCYSAFNLFTLPLYGYCPDCDDYTLLTEAQQKAEKFRCEGCGKTYELQEETLSFQCPACRQAFFWSALAASVQGRDAPESAPEGTVLQIAGTILPDGQFDPLPWYSDPQGSVSPAVGGEYAVVLRDQTGRELARHPFQPLFEPDAATYLVSLGVRLPEQAAEVEILHGSEPLYQRIISANPPLAEFVGLQPGAVCAGEQTIRWTASDPDGDPLRCSLWYRPDQGAWICIGPDLQEEHLSVDFDALPGSAAGELRLSVTDGVHTCNILSPDISVPYHAPDILTSHEESFTVTQSEIFPLSVSAYDPQDGWMYDDRITWSVDGAPYTTGNLLSLDAGTLSAGQHSLTATATNSHGLTAAKCFVVQIASVS